MYDYIITIKWPHSIAVKDVKCHYGLPAAKESHCIDLHKDRELLPGACPVPVLFFVITAGNRKFRQQRDGVSFFHPPFSELISETVATVWKMKTQRSPVKMSSIKRTNETCRQTLRNRRGGLVHTAATYLGVRDRGPGFEPVSLQGQ
jgi:hypothetical protein